MGPGNKAFITQQADFVQTPITSISGGHIGSVVYHQSSREASGLQPSLRTAVGYAIWQDTQFRMLWKSVVGQTMGVQIIRLQGWVLKLYYHEKVASHLHALCVHEGEWVKGWRLTFPSVCCVIGLSPRCMSLNVPGVLITRSKTLLPINKDHKVSLTSNKNLYVCGCQDYSKET